LLDGIPKDTLDKTTIIFMGDNGTDKAITDHFTSANFPGYGTVNHAKASVYEGGVKVPLIVADGFYVNALLGAESPAGWGRVVSP
ncbi:MAG: hypothetical protein IT579_00345, partial [Verrucomicrobia subdivision 3 bacterium]|nr:hypothetical protein [Limisphaerales bacterium]